MTPIRTAINGIRYDTERANLLASDYGGEGWHAFHERLFRTPRSGRLFLAGSGGPLTAYGGRDESGRRTHGEAIIPLTAGEAMAWAVAGRNLKALRALKDALATPPLETEDD